MIDIKWVSDTEAGAGSAWLVLHAPDETTPEWLAEIDADTDVVGVRLTRTFDERPSLGEVMDLFIDIDRALGAADKAVRGGS
jgi:hypothetical protein